MPVIYRSAIRPKSQPVQQSKSKFQYNKPRPRSYTSKMNIANNKYSKKDHQPFTRKMKTKVTINANGYFTVADATGSYLLSAWGNGLSTPFIGSNSVTVDTKFSYTMSDLAGGTSFDTAQPIGFKQWSSIYKEYKVSSSSIRVTCTPQTVADCAMLTIIPVTVQNAVANGFTGLTGSVVPQASVAGELPFSKTIMISTANNVKQNTIHHYMSTAKVNGMTPKQVSEDITNYVQVTANPDLTAGNQDNELPWCWYISLQQNTGQNFSGNLPINVEITYYVEFSEPITPIV